MLLCWNWSFYFFFLFWQFVFLLVNLLSIFSFCRSDLLTHSYQESYSVSLFKCYFFLSIFKSQKLLEYWSVIVGETIGTLSENLGLWQKFSIKTNLFHICVCVVMLNGCLPLDFVHLQQFWWLHEVTPAFALWKGQRRHHHPQKVWRPFSISVSVIGRILHPNVAMSHSCWSWFCIQFSFILFPWNAVRDYLNFVHINSHKINLLSINLRMINFIWVFSF